jgi:hypothetical protein
MRRRGSPTPRRKRVPAEIVFIGGEKLRVTEDATEIKDRVESDDWIEIRGDDRYGARAWANPAAIAYVVEAR